ncbi:transglycosylase SLT domain protein [Treponema primitia ZAS-2]|uniref:Transglycosylase SLT domain protein n=1 Tax=Treponema primitia (strain ATCC BAA-887 / DSM 12427 / ZAS-2) TaxID=545694 RepID=F5YLF3_TREPZ|nr:transglycosylase SLT domain-containing protein [Treponema primitia]AEF83581.1 transglycosylase SLT domain protein [Treponema primitia ZAS-2]
MNIKFLIPTSLVLAGLLGLNLYRRAEVCTENDPGVQEEMAQIYSWTARENAAYTAEILESLEKPDPILEYYRDEATHQEILAFFGALVQSEEIAQAILENADTFDIPPSLAFALSWGESRFNPLAVNRKNRNQTIDRGLFQLNGDSFPKLREAEFFNPSVNAYYGMAHLRWCLDVGGSEVAGLAMYNAGTNRVKAGTTPPHTLDHVSRILAFRKGIESLFQAEYIQREPQSQREIVISKTPR